MLNSIEDNPRHRAVDTLFGSTLTAPAVITSLIDSIPAIASPSATTLKNLMSKNTCPASVTGYSSDVHYSVETDNHRQSEVKINGDNVMYAIAQPPIVPILKYPADSPGLTIQRLHRMESNSAREGITSAASIPFLPHSKDTSNRHSTGALKSRKLTSLPRDVAYVPTEYSPGSSSLFCLEGKSYQENTLLKARKLEKIGSLGEPGNSNGINSLLSLAAETSCSAIEKTRSDSHDLDARCWKNGEARIYSAHEVKNSGNAAKVMNDRSIVSTDIIPDRRSSLRHQNLRPEESHFCRPSLVPTESKQYSCAAKSRNLFDDGNELHGSCVINTLDDKVEKRILQLKAKKKQRDNDYAYNEAEKVPSNRHLPTSLTSSQTIIVAEDYDRINRAYNDLGLSTTNLKPIIYPLDGTPSNRHTTDFVGPRNSSPADIDTTGDITSLKKALDAIEDSPKLSLDVARFGQVPNEQAALVASKRHSLRKSFRSQQWQYKERSKLPGVEPDRKRSNRTSKIFSQHVVETGNISYRRSRYQAVHKDVEHNVNSFLAAPRLSQMVGHPRNGRKISFSEVGDPKGHAVICCVGMGLTRFVTAFYDELARTLQLRLITPDRPGIGESERSQDDDGIPLDWPEDVLAICSSLGISQFSILAHSAGAVYAMATALCVPQYVVCRLHLLAPWITPSQLTAAGPAHNVYPVGQLPRSQRILKALPVRLLKVANAGFMSAKSSSMQRNISNPPLHPTQQRRINIDAQASIKSLPDVDVENGYRNSILLMDRIRPSISNSSTSVTAGGSTFDHRKRESGMRDASDKYQNHHDVQLTLAIWDAATTNANPAVDLLVCLERHRTIGFRYTDVDLPIVIHHGSQDTRVPLENIKWLSSVMPNCETRILEGEGHGLMASANIMGEVLTDIAREQQDRAVRTKR